MVQVSVEENMLSKASFFLGEGLGTCSCSSGTGFFGTGSLFFIRGLEGYLEGGDFRTVGFTMGDCCSAG